MKRIKRYAVLALAMCLLAAMLPMPFATAAEDGEPVLTGIEIVILPIKTEYWVGEALDTTGLTFLAIYSDGNEVDISEGFAVTGFDSSVAGEQTLTVTYMGATDTFTVTVKQPEINGIDIVSAPAKTEYWVGEALSTEGMVLLVSYTDGSVAEITEGFSVSGFQSAVAGEQTLKVTYQGATATFTVTVKQSEMTGIEIIKQPDKTEYWVGEALDTTGLTLLAIYSDESEEEITEGFVVAGFDSSVAGEQTLTVTYMGATDTFTVTVKQPEVIYIEVYSPPEKTVYRTGEELDTTGLVLLATYRNGTTSQITEGFTVTGVDSTLAGWQTVTVIYGEVAAEFSVYVEERYLTDIVISTPPKKTEYWIGELLDTTGLALTLTYSDGSVKQVTEGYTVSGFSSTNAGTKMVTVEYEGAFAVLYVEVKAPTASTITGIEIYTLPTKTEYFVGEKKDFSGLSLYVLYSDGSKKVVTSGWADSGFKSTEAGTVTITVRYNFRYTKTFTITVKERCDHTDVENGVCIRCGEVIAATVTDGSGNGIGNYMDMADALEAAESGSTVTLLSNTAIQDLRLPMGAHLDLNGCVLTVETVLTYGNSLITDGSLKNTGVLKVTDPEGDMISPNNGCLPVYDSAAGGYRFFAVEVTPCAVTGKRSDAPKYWFRVKAESFEEFYPLIRSGAEVLVQVKMTWDGQDKAVYATADVAFTKVWADRYQANEDIYITVCVTDTQGRENFRLTPGITSGGVEVFGEEM